MTPEPHYYGLASCAFWKVVNELEGDEWHELCSAGVELQNLEHRVLKLLDKLRRSK